MPPLAIKESARIAIYVDREAGKIALYVDGNYAARWTDENMDSDKPGSWFHFVSEDFYPLDISQIQLSEWDGELPGRGGAVDAALDTERNPDDDREPPREIHLAGGDLIKMEKGIFQVRSEAGLVEVPIDNVRTIDFSDGEYAEPIRKKGDVRAWTLEGEQITFRLDALGPESVKGFSQSFGDATFQLEAFERIDFNLYDEEIEKLRAGAADRAR